MLRLVLILLCLLLMPCLPAAHAQPPRASSGNRAVVAKKTTPALVDRSDRPDSYAGRQLMVGSGGGFTGFSTTYYLLDDGRLFSRRSQDTTYRFLGKQTVANTKRAFAAVEITGRIKKVRFDNPGNTYKFVRWKKGKQQYNVTWGAPGITVPATYRKFYDSFMNMISASARLK